MRLFWSDSNSEEESEEYDVVDACEDWKESGDVARGLVLRILSNKNIVSVLPVEFIVVVKDCWTVGRWGCTLMLEAVDFSFVRPR